MTTTKQHLAQSSPFPVERLASFSDGNAGGNPAGVVICDALPDAATMQAIAAEVGYSETAFAAPLDGVWRVRYFAPEIEVPFCGHATFALGAALARREGDGMFHLRLNSAEITVEGRRDGAALAAALQSPPTRSEPAPPDLVSDALALLAIPKRTSIRAYRPRLRKVVRSISSLRSPRVPVSLKCTMTSMLAAN